MMRHDVSLANRLRIERRVWGLDHHLYELPARARVAHRRELRANLLAAAADVGTAEALRRVGGSRDLADEILTAELGGRRRASWVGTGAFAILALPLLNVFLDQAARAYSDGVTAADPHATGTFTWSGVRYLQSAMFFHFRHGSVTSDGGAWTPLVYLLWVAGVIIAGRLWRLLPRSGQRSGRTAPGDAATE